MKPYICVCCGEAMSETCTWNPNLCVSCGLIAFDQEDNQHIAGPVQQSEQKQPELALPANFEPKPIAA